MTWSNVAVAGGLMLSLLIGGLAVAWLERMRSVRRPPDQAVSRSLVDEQPAPEALSAAEVRGLVDQIAVSLLDGNCVLVVGPGLASALSEPTPATVGRALLQAREAPVGKGGAKAIGDLLANPIGLAEGDLRTDLLNVISDILPEQFVQAEISRQFRIKRRGDGRPPAWVRTLQRLPLGTIVSLNWSDQFDFPFRASNGEALVTWGSNDDARGALEAAGTRVFKPLGDIRTPSSLRLCIPRRVSGLDAEVLRALSYALSGKSLLFVGMTADEILSFMDAATPSRSPAASHALISTHSGPDGQSEAMLSLRHRIRAVSVDEGRLTGLLDTLLQRIGQRDRPAGQTNEALLVKRLRLVHIGPFADLSLDIHPSWTVLLGDNGSGKSTALKAMALCLAGQSYDQDTSMSLLNVAAQEGSIELTIGNTTFTTRLVRDRASVRVESSGLTPVEAGKLLAIGLPPLRGLATHEISGPRATTGYPGGDPIDLVPLIVGALDSRFDDIRQWLVNVAVTAEGRGSDARSARTQINTMFDIFRRLNPGLDIKYAGLDRKSWDVQVVVNGADTIPVRLLSQGSLATISWVGLLVKRLTDTFGPDIMARPAAATGLVVIDEIDAHLHPEWQRNIIPALSKHFPAVQFVASTHSPLIVGALTVGSVVTIKRYEAGYAEATYAGDFTGWRADQILTSEAFGLESTRDVVSTGKLAAYEQSLSSKTRDEPASVSESRRKMEQELTAQLTRTGETSAARSAAAIVDEVLDSHLKSLSATQAKEMSEQLSSYLRRVRGEEG